MNLKKKATQMEFSTFLGVNQSTVSKAIAARILTKGATAEQWIREWFSHLEEIAAGRQSANGNSLDLIAERARLAKMQADKIQVELDEKFGELVPIENIILGITSTFSVLKSRLLGLPNYLVSRGYIEKPNFSKVTEKIRDFLIELSQMKMPANVREKMKKIDRQYAKKFDRPSGPPGTPKKRRNILKKEVTQ